MNRAVKHVQSIGKNDEWETPRDIYQMAVLWAATQPKLDVAASAQNTKCRDFMTAGIDALTQEWTSDWWCNPPYSKVAEFIKHGIEQSRKHGVRGIFLTYAKTDTKWWHKYVEEYEDVYYRFVKGRIRFLKDGVPQGPAPYPSVILRVGY